MFIIFTFITILLLIGSYLALWKFYPSIIEKFTSWLIFTVLLASLPVIFNAILIFLTGNDPTLDQTTKNGELLIVAVAIGADATGKLSGSKTSKKLLKTLLVGACIILIILSSFLFSIISTNLLKITLDVARVSITSLIMLFATIVTAGSSNIIAETQ